MSGDVVSVLGSSGAQTILAVGLVALAAFVLAQQRAQNQMQRERIAELREVLKQQAADARLIAEAMLRMQATLDLALASLKGAR